MGLSESSSWYTFCRENRITFRFTNRMLFHMWWWIVEGRVVEFKTLAVNIGSANKNESASGSDRWFPSTWKRRKRDKLKRKLNPNINIYSAQKVFHIKFKFVYSFHRIIPILNPSTAIIQEVHNILSTRKLRPNLRRSGRSNEPSDDNFIPNGPYLHRKVVVNYSNVLPVDCPATATKPLRLPYTGSKIRVEL